MNSCFHANIRDQGDAEQSDKDIGSPAEAIACVDRFACDAMLRQQTSITVAVLRVGFTSPFGHRRAPLFCLVRGL